ncbi:alpha/beta fold hydrolase [Variovorax sp. J22R24]|uniref:alpha/beta hydrolase n=1 Tax=Variovorax gracilis TaxID=3053502 RepID=UPI0025791059|nr:alpha/beta fold hydrolase [Variovorax sp. J22R24]MDM0110061.1 alpha/beta fold hydrolase [Variovorax sp. J22R24]
MELEGDSIAEFAAALSEEVIRRQVWPKQADRVFVTAYVDGECGPKDRTPDTLLLKISAEEAGQLRSELQRRGGGAPTPAVNVVSERAQLTPGQAPSGPPGASRINWLRIFYATNRKPTGQTVAATAFGTDDAETISWGSVDVSIPHEHKMGQLESPAIWRLEWEDPTKHIALAPRLNPLSPERWRQEVLSRATAMGRPGVLVFIHGYNVSFANAARRTAQFAYDTAFKGPTVLFSWPSDGNLIPYMRDEADAFAAKRFMADVLKTVTTLAPGVPVYVVAHSMGNRVMLHGYAELLRRNPDAHQAIRQVVMAAPDVGQREFKQVFKDFAGTKPRYTLYASDQDVPVNVSEWLHGDRRLGNGGANTAVFVGVDSIDASAVTREFFGLSHSYFGESDTLLSDLFALIHQGLPPDQRHRLKPTDGKQGRFWSFAP